MAKLDSPNSQPLEEASSGKRWRHFPQKAKWWQLAYLYVYMYMLLLLDMRSPCTHNLHLSVWSKNHSSHSHPHRSILISSLVAIACMATHAILLLPARLDLTYLHNFKQLQIHLVNMSWCKYFTLLDVRQHWKSWIHCSVILILLKNNLINH